MGNLGSVELGMIAVLVAVPLIAIVVVARGDGGRGAGGTGRVASGAGLYRATGWVVLVVGLLLAVGAGTGEGGGWLSIASAAFVGALPLFGIARILEFQAAQTEELLRLSAAVERLTDRESAAQP